MVPRTNISIDELELSFSDKIILKAVINIPLDIQFGKYIVDEAFFMTNKYSDSQKKAFYNCANALNEKFK